MKGCATTIFVACLAAWVSNAELARAAAPDDTMIPVRPGVPAKVPFWNAHAERFIYAPVFDAPPVDGAKSYTFTINDHADKSHTFTADTPNAALSPVWADVAEGYTTLKVEALDASGKSIGKPYERVFYRSPGFSGTAEPAPSDYRKAGVRGLHAMLESPRVQTWLTQNTPDRSYALYCYPNKVIGGLTRGMAALAERSENSDDRAAAKKIATTAADYLLSLRYPADAKYSNVPPTYALNVDKPTGVTTPRVNDKWLFVPSVVDAALALCDVYDVTKDQKYLDGANGIADTLVRAQDADGTWPLMVNYQTGEPAAPQRLIPTWVLFFFDRLDTAYKQPQYKDARAKAWNWIVENPLKTYQWDAQFEDVKIKGPYENMAREQACDVAGLLLSNPQHTEADVAQAMELIRFAEDQFALWAPVQDVDGWRKAMPDRYKTCDIWMTPCVFEQFVCYGPVARSAAILINTYIKAYEVTQQPAYLEKAKALGNGMLEGQAYATKEYGTNGEMLTWNMKRKPSNWLNNSFYAADAVLHLADATSPESVSKK